MTQSARRPSAFRCAVVFNGLPATIAEGNGSFRFAPRFSPRVPAAASIQASVPTLTRRNGSSTWTLGSADSLNSCVGNQSV